VRSLYWTKLNISNAIISNIQFNTNTIKEVNKETLIST
jgi:hypothetical protein